MNKEAKFNLGFIGAGKITSEYLKIFSQMKEVKLSAIHSRNKNKAEDLAKKYTSLNVYKDLDDMRSNEDLDLVVVAVSLESIFQIALKILDFEWKIFFEKPLGINLHEFSAIKKKCLKNNKNIHIGLNRRNYFSTIKLIKFLNETTGNRFIQINDQEDTDLLLKNNIDNNIINSWMYCNSIHLIDYASFLTRGKISKIENIIPWNKGSDHVLSLLHYSSGDKVLYKAIWNEPSPWSVTINTKDIFFIKQPLEELKIIKKDSRQIINIETPELDTVFKPGFYNQAKEIINYLKDHDHNLVNLEEYEKTVKIIRGIYAT